MKSCLAPCRDLYLSYPYDKRGARYMDHQTVQEMQKILVLGATGFLGKRLVNRLLDQQFQVKVLVRDIAKASHLLEHDKVEIIRGAYFDKAMLAEAVAEVDSVITTISPKPFTKVSDEEMSQYKASFTALISLLETQDINRFIHIAGSTVKFAGEKLSVRRRVLRIILTTIAKPAILLKDFELQALKNSTLNWVSIRPPRFKEGMKGSLVADAETMPGGTIDVDQLADFMIGQIEEDPWVGKTPFVATV